jgi:hypothetical protein
VRCGRSGTVLEVSLYGVEEQPLFSSAFTAAAAVRRRRNRAPFDGRRTPKSILVYPLRPSVCGLTRTPFVR